MPKVYCKNTGSSKEFNEGTSLMSIVKGFDFDKPYDILAAKVNNVTQGLRYRVFNNKDVEQNFRTVCETIDKTIRGIIYDQL